MSCLTLIQDSRDPEIKKKSVSLSIDIRPYTAWTNPLQTHRLDFQNKLSDNRSVCPEKTYTTQNII